MRPDAGRQPNKQHRGFVTGIAFAAFRNAPGHCRGAAAPWRR